jgi:drug/metabolite transporter (DMT)-like permease
VVSVLCGLAAAVLWASATVSSTRSSRMLGAPVVVAWVLVVGLVLSAPVVAAGGTPAHLHEALPWLALSAVGAVSGFLLTYTALQDGQVSLIAPIVSAEGAVAAIVAVAAGEPLSRASGLALVAIAIGVALASANQGPAAEGAPHPVRALLLAGTAAVAFGISLYASGRAGQDVPAIWVTFSARLLGTVVVLLPLALMGALRLTRAALPYVLFSGVCEIVGFTTYVVGARHSVAVTAVTASQFAAIAALGGVVLFGERLARVQIGGVAVIVVAVTALSALQA